MTLTLLIIISIVIVIAFFYSRRKKAGALMKPLESSIVEQPKEEKEIIKYSGDEKGRE